MRTKINLEFLGNPMWRRVLALISVLLFIDLSDAILSDWVPSYLQEVLGGSFLMGLVFSFSSIVGFATDLIFPQLFKGVLVKHLLRWAMGASMLFVVSLFFAALKPLLPVLLVAMAVWGVYYEFLAFANQQFVATVATPHDRARVWAVVGVFKSFAYFFGPIIGGLLINRGGNFGVVLASGVITLVSFFMLNFLKLADDKTTEVELNNVNLLAEISHWRVLLAHVWPVVTISLVLGLIDSTFWTTGAVLSDALASRHAWGFMFLPMYMLPSMFVGFLVFKWGIYQGKKKWAEVFMLLSGILLLLLGLSDGVIWQLSLVFLASSALSVSYPLTDAVYSDILARMGRERKHMLGLSSSTISLAYIVGPAAAGWVASLVGERMTFSALGLGVIFVSGVLLLVTPKKIKLPQTEIEGWDRGVEAR